MTSSDRFTTKSQIVVEDKAKRKSFAHIDVTYVDNKPFVKCAGEHKRRLQHVLGDIELDRVLAEIIRRRDGKIEAMITESIKTEDLSLIHI